MSSDRRYQFAKSSRRSLFQPFFFLVADQLHSFSDIRWTSNADTVAGGHSCGHQENKLDKCTSLDIDINGNIIVADFNNHRIVEWAPGATRGQIIAGGNGRGNKLNQLNQPSDVIVDKEKTSLLICDYGNRRVVRWARRKGEELLMMIENIDCCRLTMDGRGFLYVTDVKKDEVRSYRLEGNYYETIYTVVAGGHGRGSAFHQLQIPTNIFVDGEQTVYVSDKGNNRVMKWKIGAEQGIVVAGGKGMGNDLEHLNHPRGLFVDVKGTVYIADYKNHRVMRWRTNSHGTVIVGGDGSGHQAHQLNGPMSLSVDRHNNLYVVDCFNHRVQRFSVTGKFGLVTDNETSPTDTTCLSTYFIHC